MLGSTGLRAFDPEEDLAEEDQGDDDAADVEIETEPADEPAPAKRKRGRKPARKAASRNRRRRKAAKAPAKRSVKASQRFRAGASKEACPSCGVAHNSRHGTDEIERITFDALDGWERVADPILAPIRSLARRAGSYDEFLAGLPGLLSEMDGSRMVETLAAAMFKGRGLGDTGAAP